jgi:chaperonin GroEL (HSP60 family)
MYTNVLLEKDSKKEIKRFVDSLSASMNNLLLGRLSITYGKSIVRLSPVDIVRVISEMPINSSAELSIRNIFLSSIIESENRCKLSGFVAAVFACHAIKHMFKHNTTDDKSFQHDMSVLSQKSHVVTSSEALKIIEMLSGDKLSNRIIRETLLMAGASGKVLVGLTPENETIISSFVGYKFPVSPHPSFISAGFTEQWNRQNVLCLSIDGIIEKMSEIEKIIYALSEDKTPCILFARGFNDEVVSTLAVNFLRNTLDVIPVVVPFDETGINMLNDIATVMGGDVISSLKGELISQKTRADLSVINEAKIENGSTILCHDKFKENILKHIVRLKKTAGIGFNTDEESVGIKKKELVEKRISSLTGEGVQIKIGMSLGQKRGIILDRIQSGLDLFKGMCRFGVIDIENFQSNSILIDTPIQNLRRTQRCMPTSSLLIGMQKGHQISKDISKLSVIVSQDN